MRIRDLILPEDKIFFTLFKEMTEKITEASTVLNEITHSPRPQGGNELRLVKYLKDKEA